MAKRVELRPLTRGERQLLQVKLTDLFLAAQVHQRYRVIDELREGYRLVASTVPIHKKHPLWSTLSGNRPFGNGWTGT
jgi:hypothetical protein